MVELNVCRAIRHACGSQTVRLWLDFLLEREREKDDNSALYSAYLSIPPCKFT